MRKRANEAKSGFRRAGLWLLGFAWLFLVFSGLAIISSQPPPSHPLGWVLLAMAAVVAIVTMDRWIRVFPGLLAYGVLGSVLTLIDGHAVNHPEVYVSRAEALFMILFFAVATALSLTFTHRRLHVWDRIALILFIFCFFWQAVAPNVMRLALGIGFSCLLLAWAYDRIQARKMRHGSHPDHITV